MMAAGVVASLLSEAQERELGQAVADLAGGNAALYAALLDSLIETIMADVADVLQASRTQDGTLLRAAAHRLKGCGGIVRCRALVECGRRLEAAADAGDAGALPSLASDCVRTGNAVAGTLRALRQDRQGF